MYTFQSKFTPVGTMSDYTQKEVKNEPMLFNCDLETAYKLGGPITREFVNKCTKEDWDNAVIDTRVHMLMKGWFPCIPGFHHDDVPRSRSDGQPNYDTPEYKAVHYMALINGDICPTEFAVGETVLPEVPLGDIIYKNWHDVTEQMIAEGKLVRTPVPTNTIVEFDWLAMHQGVRAIADGWRWFGRISYNTHRKPTNELRRQVQVYLENPMEGW